MTSNILVRQNFIDVTIDGVDVRCKNYLNIHELHTADAICHIYALMIQFNRSSDFMSQYIDILGENSRPIVALQRAHQICGSQDRNRGAPKPGLGRGQLPLRR